MYPNSFSRMSRVFKRRSSESKPTSNSESIREIFPMADCRKYLHLNKPILRERTFDPSRSRCSIAYEKENYAVFAAKKGCQRDNVVNALAPHLSCRRRGRPLCRPGLAAFGNWWRGSNALRGSSIVEHLNRVASRCRSPRAEVAQVRGRQRGARYDQRTPQPPNFSSSKEAID